MVHIIHLTSEDHYCLCVHMECIVFLCSSVYIPNMLCVLNPKYQTCSETLAYCL